MNLKTAVHPSADAPGPFIATRGLIPGLARSAAFESPGINIFPAQEQASEQRDLLIRRRGLGDLRGCGRCVGLARGCILHGLECRGRYDVCKPGQLLGRSGEPSLEPAREDTSPTVRWGGVRMHRTNPKGVGRSLTVWVS